MPCILIAEDSYIIRELWRIYLEPQHHCALAADGVQAVNLHREALQAGRPFDLLLTDLSMPVMDGLTALALIRQEEQARGLPPIRSIVVTAMSGVNGYQERFDGLGVDAVLTKPVEQETLVDQVRQTLERGG